MGSGYVEMGKAKGAVTGLRKHGAWWLTQVDFSWITGAGEGNDGKAGK